MSVYIGACPCCGGVSGLLYDNDSSSKWVECFVCGLATAIHARGIPDKDLADRWNTRHSTSGKVLEEGVKS